MPNAQSKPVQKQEELYEVSYSLQNKRRWIHIHWTGGQNSCVKKQAFNSIEDYYEELPEGKNRGDIRKSYNTDARASNAGLSTSSQQKVVQQKPTTSSFQYNFLDAPTVSREGQSAAWGIQTIPQSHSCPSKPALQYVEPTIVSTSNYRPLSNSSVPGLFQVALIKPINASTTNSLPLSNHSPFPQFTNSKPLFKPYPQPFIPTQQVNDMKSTLLLNFNPLQTFNYSGPEPFAPWHCQIINQTHPAPIPIVQQFGRVKPLLYVSRKRTQIPPEMEHIAFQGTYKIEAEGRDRTGNILAGAYYGITINYIARIPDGLSLNGNLIDL